MKWKKGVRRLCLLLWMMVMVPGLLHISAQAEEASQERFVLVAETNESLIIAPTYVYHAGGETTVKEALGNSQYTFTGLETGMVTAIEGKSGNFSRSDQTGSYDFTKNASQVTHYCFSERSSSNSKPSDGVLLMMTTMADYLEKDTDVQKAAKEAYENALAQFVRIKNDSDSATTLAITLRNAMSAYEEVQKGTKYKVSFVDGSANLYKDGLYSGISISAVNQFGKEWEDNGDGVMELPAGTYTFRIHHDGLSVSCVAAVSGDITVTAALPVTPWLKLEKFRLSGSYGSETNEYNKFTDAEFSLESWGDDRFLTVRVPDTFSGAVYTYAEYDAELVSGIPKLSAHYQMKNEAQTKIHEVISFQSLNSGIYSVLAKGTQGNTVVYQVSCEKDGYTYAQDYTVEFVRIPTLGAITVIGTDEDGKEVPQAATEVFQGTRTEYTYKVLNTVEQVVVTAEPFWPEGEYSITVKNAGENNNAQAGVTVAIPKNEDSVIELVVSANGQSNLYRLTIQPGKGRTLTMVCKEDVELQVLNKNGMVMPYTTSFSQESGKATNKIYKYILIPGESYTYTATHNTYYHATAEVYLKDNANTTVTVDFDGMEDWLKDLAFGIGGNYYNYKGNLKLNQTFKGENHYYQISCVDTVDTVYAWATLQDNTKTDIQAIYQQVFPDVGYHGIENRVEIDTGLMGTSLVRFLMYQNPIENALTVRLSRTIDGVLHYQDYVVDFKRELTLANLEASCEGNTVVLQQPNGQNGFASAQREYNVKVSMAATSLDLSFQRYTGNTCYGEEEVGYRVKINGQDMTESGKAVIPLNASINTQTVTIAVENPKAPEGTGVYTLNILKSPPVETKFDINPSNAVLNIREILSGERLWPNGEENYQLCEGYSYEYALTQYGYISKSGTLTVTQNDRNELVILDGIQQYPVSGNAEGGVAAIPWTLNPAPVNESVVYLDSQWPNFRGDESNNAVTNAPVPNLAENGTLYWAQKRGAGFDADAVGSPILVDGDLIAYAGNSIFRMDSMTGEIKVTGEMDHKSSFSITPPTYAEGMVFVALSDGCVQAFNASTLEPLWIYKDPLGGQPNCPITVKNGYLYTGFWNSETGNARFVCLSITDEDPGNLKETKCASWFQMAKGGFYWAGAYVSDRFVLVGTDDGTNLCTSYSSRMLLLDAKTGKLLDSWDNLHGDIRCTVVYDEQTDAYYFTSKGGSFYSVRVSKDLKLTDKWEVALHNGSDQPAMSTCSPVVYNGRAYVGVSGAAQFGQYTGHNITVIDVNGQRIAYSVQTQGYPQTSGLLTTAYGDNVYVYFFDNYTPGKLRVLQDSPGQTAANLITMENNIATAYALFTPTGEHAQYAICSPIVDEYGTVYFKNDSAYLMAFGSAIEKIEVTTPPNKTSYLVGEKFDPMGMVVTATYANGKTRDVTAYVAYHQEKLTMEDTSFTIRFEILEYHNQEDGQGMKSGVVSSTPTVTLDLKITTSLLGDVNMDGELTAEDAQLILDYEAQLQQEEPVKAVADVSGDEVVNSDDAVLILQRISGELQTFPVQQEQTQNEQ